jgi:putative transposase
MVALVSLSESARKIALDRFRLLQPHFEDKRLLKAVAREAGIGYRTAQRWKMRYRKYGLAGLARDDRSDRGQRRAITAELKEILEALALEKPPSAIAALHRQICKIG